MLEQNIEGGGHTVLDVYSVDLSFYVLLDSEQLCAISSADWPEQSHSRVESTTSSVSGSNPGECRTHQRLQLQLSACESRASLQNDDGHD